MSKKPLCSVAILLLLVACPPLEACLQFDFDPSSQYLDKLLRLGNAEIVESVGNGGFLRLSNESTPISAVVFPEIHCIQLHRFYVGFDLRQETEWKTELGTEVSFPATGLSFNFVRPIDPIIGTADMGLTGSPTTIAEYFAEDGSARSGISVSFDPWGSLGTDFEITAPETCSDPQFDCVGISVSVDGERIHRIPLALARSEANESWEEFRIGAVSPSLDDRRKGSLLVQYGEQEVFLGAIPLVVGPARLVISNSTTTRPGTIQQLDNLFAVSLDGPSNLAGDFNEDGVLDEADYLTLVHYMNTEQTSGNSDLYFDGDIDDSGQINIADFVQFREEWFRFHGDSAIPVPEPSSATALLLGTLTTLYWLRDRRSFGG